MATAEHAVSVARPGRPSRGSGDPRDLPPPPVLAPAVAAVERCYSMVHCCEALGIRDLADGEFLATDTTLEEGIARQVDHLLDLVGCTRPGFRLLEIGCGYGRLLRRAQERGALVVGVNISPEQVRYCRERGSVVHACDFRDLRAATEWHGRFDGVVANGSLEHWVQPEDVLAGRSDALYADTFALVRDLLDPDASEARYATTAIHVVREAHPQDLLVPWWKHPRGSDRRHYALLHQWMGGWYPVPGELAACARPWFDLEVEEDGTTGYRIANDRRLERMRRGLWTSSRMLGRIARSVLLHPRAALTMLECYFVEQSWDWQFRGDDPPMRLLRHTWRVRPRTGH